MVVLQTLPAAPSSSPSAARGSALVADRLSPSGRSRSGLASRVLSARSLVVIPLVASGFALAGCLGPDRDTLTVEEFTRERVVRERTHAKIEADHAALTALIASDRFENPEAIYGDPELRALALHLIEQSRKLERLADSDVLAPGSPESSDAAAAPEDPDSPDAPDTTGASGAP